MTRRESANERAAWTAHFEGGTINVSNKYGAERSGKYASKHEAQVVSDLAALAAAGHIQDLREQVSFTLVPANGKLRSIRYIADFTFWEGGLFVVADAKGFAKNPVYRLKKRLLAHMHGFEIREL